MIKKFYLILILILGLAVGFITYFFWPDEKSALAKVVILKSRNLTYEVDTNAETVEELLSEQGLRTANTKESASPVDYGMVIDIKNEVSVDIIDGGISKSFSASVETVGDLIYQQKIVLAKTDRVTPDLSVFLTEGMRIVIDRIVDIEETDVSEIPFEVVLQNDPNTLYGHEKVLQKGEVGTLKSDFLVTYTNGVETKRKLLKKNIIKQAQKEVQQFGTKIVIERSDVGRASWYAYKGCLCAAHPYYEKGRYVKVTAQATGKSVIVKINDFGPDQSIHPDRVIDLDSVAFKKLAPLGAGTIEVKAELLAR